MAKCQSCGRELTKARGFFFIVCKDCEASWPRVQEERKGVEAKDRLGLIIKEYIKGETLKAFGLAYWDTAGSAVNSVINKAVGGALLGGIGMQLTGKTHRFGVIAATETHLRVIDLGELVGETISADMIRNRSTQGKEKCFNFKEVIIQDKYPKAANTLIILKPIQLNAIFPSSFDPDNTQKAAQIADAINSTRKIASPTLNPVIKQADRIPGPTGKDDKASGPSLPRMTGMLICPECGTKVLPKQNGTCPSCQSKIVE